ncbi:MAG: ferredoxin [Candidatus Anammoxibacter sp.]
MVAKVDGDACTGCEMCTQTCPEVFEMDGDKSVALNSGNVAEDAEESCKQAAEECPVEAIAVS